MTTVYSIFKSNLINKRREFHLEFEVEALLKFGGKETCKFIFKFGNFS